MFVNKLLHTVVKYNSDVKSFQMYICFQVFMNFISYSLKNNFLKDTGTISLLTAKEISTRDSNNK